MPTQYIVVIGASAGGIEALGEVVAGLPLDIDAAIFVVQHMASSLESHLPKILQRRTSLPVSSAIDRDEIRRGSVYVAPPDYHLLVDRKQMFLSHGPRENRVRPAVDPLFRSAALSWGRQAIGVILSGSLDDGTSGLLAIKKAGGRSIVQDPSTAVTPDMPQSALDYVEIDHCKPLREIGPLLGQLTSEPVPSEANREPNDFDHAILAREVEIMTRETGDIATAVELGELVPASCPDCGGPMWEIDEAVPRFRCHTGHAYTARHLAAGLQEAEEQSLWVALRVMEERVRMLRRLAKQDSRRGHKLAAESFEQKAAEADEHVRRLRSLLTLPNRNRQA